MLGGKCHMKLPHILIALGLAVSMRAADETGSQTNQATKPLPHSWVDDRTEVTCKPAYYRRASDGLLVPVEEAKRTENLMVSGVVFNRRRTAPFRRPSVELPFRLRCGEVGPLVQTRPAILGNHSNGLYRAAPVLV
jgi:hypothetical protein